MFFFKKKNKKKVKILNKIVILIDPGHGGSDPGAIGKKGTKEKNITLNIAKKLKNLLNKNKSFFALLTRNDDSYISLKKRKKFLKKNHVNLLISIHVNSSKEKYISGPSIWIVSKKRIIREINNFIKNKEIIYFPKNIQNILKKNKHNISLKKITLSKEYNNFQKIEIRLSKIIFEQFKKIVKLKKNYPNYASLSILSAINTPSILIETGFITNINEEKKLQKIQYQKKIATAIYIALKNFFQKK